MELFHLFKKKLPKKKVVWCIGIPFTYNSFIICCRKKEKSDFIESLELKYKTTDEELLWKFFKPTADNIAETKNYLSQMNVTVVELSCVEQLRDVFSFETVILTAHRHRYFDCLDLLGNSIEIDDIVKEIPENFDGIMDISSCYSSVFQKTCKKRAIFATYIAAETESSLDLRLFIYKQTIRHLASHKGNNYLDSFRVILYRMIETGFIKNDSTGTVFLGGNKVSSCNRNSNISVFSQKEAKVGDTFMIQVYGYDHDKRRSVISHAKKADSDSSERDCIPLNVSLNEGDNITLSISVFNSPELSQTKTLCWTKSIARTHFLISVPSEYKNPKMFLEILVTINKVIIGELSFSVNIVRDHCKSDGLAEVFSKKFNKVFISYSHLDENKVKYIAHAYKAIGTNYFFDRHYLKAGSIYPDEIKDFINSADLFILCWSRNASNSEYMQEELAQALQLAFPQVQPKEKAQLTIYPMLLENNVDLPSKMKDIYNFITL